MNTQEYRMEKFKPHNRRKRIGYGWIQLLMAGLAASIVVLAAVDHGGDAFFYSQQLGSAFFWSTIGLLVLIRLTTRNRPPGRFEQPKDEQ
jgi:hypothetical protein